MYMEKQCNKCLKNKDIKEFNKKCDSKDGYRTICRECQKLGRNKDKEAKQYKIWAEKNRNKLNSYAKAYRANKPKKERKKKSKEEIKEYNRLYYKNRRENDNLYRLRKNIQRNICKNLKHFTNGNRSKTLTIIGCSYEELKQYLESKFEPWMSWENYGLYNGKPNHGWDIDHIIPTSSAKTKEDLYNLNHYTNLQPLCSYVNRAVKQDHLCE